MYFVRMPSLLRYQRARGGLASRRAIVHLFDETIFFGVIRYNNEVCCAFKLRLDIQRVPKTGTLIAQLGGRAFLVHLSVETELEGGDV